MFLYEKIDIYVKEYRMLDPWIFRIWIQREWKIEESNQTLVITNKQKQFCQLPDKKKYFMNFLDQYKKIDIDT